MLSCTLDGHTTVEKRCRGALAARAAATIGSCYLSRASAEHHCAILPARVAGANFDAKAIVRYKDTLLDVLVNNFRSHLESLFNVLSRLCGSL